MSHANACQAITVVWWCTSTRLGLGNNYNVTLHAASRALYTAVEEGALVLALIQTVHVVCGCTHPCMLGFVQEEKSRVLHVALRWTGQGAAAHQPQPALHNSLSLHGSSGSRAAWWRHRRWVR